ncbi:hypothetical protein NSQ91_13925 [Paenibacillus sp. FSL R7-0048]|uniref:hypothetical protein n=1 Tax=Paenibacillus TaxID=44249 RepID=UPI00096C19FE|nr:MULTISPECIES: hypothetical protein [Paenibacillus]OMD87792.1 hypothetical protein BSK53_02040 [Paenibacillus odorifer]QUL57538.1 hypothetical protein KDC22_14305 [Paenibacillus tritici]
MDLIARLEAYVKEEIQPKYTYPIGLVHTKAFEEAGKGRLYIWIDKGVTFDHKFIDLPEKLYTSGKIS